MIAGFYGFKIDLNSLRRQNASSMRGASLKSIVAVADQLGFTSRPVKLPLEALHALQMPAILHWNMNHYVVLDRIDRDRALILDPASGSARRISMSEVSEHFTGIALELSPSDGFKVQDKRERLQIRQLWTKLSGVKQAIFQIALLTVVMQIFTLVSPYYIQIAIDYIVPTVDVNLMVILAIGFGFITIFGAAVELFRGFILLSAGATMGYGLTSNLGRKLFRLPVGWFERRNVGDVLSRFQSVRPIQDALIQNLAPSLIDGISSILILGLMTWYSLKLVLFAILSLIAYFAIRIFTFAIEREGRESLIVNAGREQSILIETLRGVSTLRLYGRESERHILWQDRLVDEVNSSVRISRIAIWQSCVNAIIFGLEHVISIYISIKLVVTGGFSVGMVVAYLAYKQIFITRMATLVDQCIAFSMLGLHLERLGDIALQNEDFSFTEGLIDNSERFRGSVELKGVSYRYSPTDPWVLRGVDLRIAPGSHVAISGGSGGGKSTLAKILLGLDQPEDGEILIDGEPIHKFGYRRYRSQVAAVMQDDHLFAGSLADNIALFDESADYDLIVQSATAAAIHDEISAMPMKYDSLVGDMGSALSGGQKARILLARALYRKPKLLLLDEGTAHLDPATEKRVNESIASLGITRIVIAHRHGPLESATESWELRGGRLYPNSASPVSYI